ncbi:MAG: hypothetical protein GAK35_01384 [Herbaspirillum frisingense]|uniref:Heme-binding protein n=1 Tax=Herbaspirillum frisingense TaxID=92645 RepID=A0A7V8FY65_9BURK|nr:MAG: hypothetical protein GAK35_01384 [Herbaspirillum frisingense]
MNALNPSSATKTFSTASITAAAANALIAEARVAAAGLGIQVCIAVTDAAGHLTAFERGDGAPFLSAEVAIDKAWTVSAFGLATHVWNDILKDGKVAQLAHRPRMVAVGGGCPIVENGKVVGAIGISGGNAEQDRQAAEQALRALGFEVA